MFEVVNGCGDYFSYMRFDSEETYRRYLGWCQDNGIGIAYPDCGYAESSIPGHLEDKVKTTTAKMIDTLLEKGKSVYYELYGDGYEVEDMEDDEHWDDEYEEEEDDEED